MTDEQKPDNTNPQEGSSWLWILVLAVVVIAGAGAYYYFSANKDNSAVAQNQTQDQTQQQQQTQATATPGVKFSDTNFAKYAYLISGTSNYDSKTKAALAGFKVDRKAQPDGTEVITLNATNPEYQTQTYAVKPGEKLYFIETTLRDDPVGQELNMGDDKAVVVDANGYIVAQP